METEYGETTFYQIINDEKRIDTDKGSSQSGYRAGDGPRQPDKDFPALAGSASGRIETEQGMASHPSLAKTIGHLHHQLAQQVLQVLTHELDAPDAPAVSGVPPAWLQEVIVFYHHHHIGICQLRLTL